MKELIFLFLLVTLSPKVFGQDALGDNEIVLFSPINFGPMVYVKAEKSLERFVYSKVFDSKSEVSLECGIPNKHLWFCTKTKPLVFQGLDGQGKRVRKFFLCDENSGIAIQKYYSEKLLSYKCGVSGGWSENQQSFYAEQHEET